MGKDMSWSDARSAKQCLDILCKLLWVEESSTRLHMRLYDRFYEKLHRLMTHTQTYHPDLFRINVPGVGERKPALNVANRFVAVDS